MQQLRACGVLETVRISAAGYPSRWTYGDFLHRYQMLLSRRERSKGAPKLECEAIVRRLIADADKFQFGASKIFFRAGQVAYLEKLRAERMKLAATRIQARIRGWLQRRRYTRLQRLALQLQCLIRRRMARVLAQRLRETAAATTLQARVRGFVARRRYVRLLATALALQRCIRGYIARKDYLAWRRQAMAVRIQSLVRAALARQRYRQYIRSVTIVQACVRRRQARQLLRRLKVEARSVDGLKQINYGLERKIIELQQKLDAKGREASTKHAERIAELEKALELARQQSAAAQASNVSAGALEAELSDARAHLHAAQSRNHALEGELRDARSAAAAAIDSFGTKVMLECAPCAAHCMQIIALNDELDEARARLHDAAALRSELEQLKCGAADMAAQMSAERTHHQRRLKEFAELEATVTELRTQLNTAQLQSIRDVPAGAASLNASQNDASALADSDGGIIDDDAMDNLRIGELEAEMEQLRGRLEAEARSSASAAAQQQEEHRRQLAALQRQCDEQKLIASLVQELSDSEDVHLAQDLAQAKGRISELESQLATGEAAADLQHRIDSMAADARSTSALCAQYQAEISSLRTDVARLRGENDQLMLVSSESQRLAEDGAGTPALAARAAELKDLGLDPSLDVESVRQELVTAQADLARLMFANHKLKERVGELEKQPGKRGPAGAVLQRVLRMTTAAAQTDLIMLGDAPSASERVLALEAELQLARADVAALTDSLSQARSARDKENEALGVNALVMAKTALQERCATLHEDLDDARNVLEMRKGEHERLRVENQTLAERVTKLEKALVKKLPSPAAGAGHEEGLKREVTFLVNENLNMRELVEMLEKKVKDLERRNSTLAQAAAGITGSAVEQAPAAENGNGKPLEAQVSLKGMFKISEKDIQRLVNVLVLQLQPESSAGQLPGLAAHVLFMCVLYADSIDNAAMLQALLAKTIGGIKSVVVGNASNLPTLAFWLANGYRLMCNMREFSREHASKTAPPRAVTQTFDLAEYRMVLSDLLVQIFSAIVHTLHIALSSMVVPGILEHEGIPNMVASAPVGKKARPAVKSDVTVRTIESFLQGALDVLARFYVDPHVVKQVFTQLFALMNAALVNNILLRKDLCHCFKGVQIRYNINQLQEWALARKLEDMRGVLAETVQVCGLLQINKSSLACVDSICDTTAALNPLQVQKILSMYVPMDGEERVPAAVIRAVAERGADRADPAKLMMDSSHHFPVVFPFSECHVDFAQLAIPPQLADDLAFLVRM